MFDTKEDLLAQIRLGEDSRLELKAVKFRGDRVAGPHADGLADEMAAFANSSGASCWTKVLMATSLHSENQALRSENGPGDIFRAILYPNQLIPKESS